MAFVEQIGKNSWRVRYTKDDGTIGSIPGFTSKTTAQDKADEIDADRRRGTFLDPSAGKLLLGEFTTPWFDSIDVARSTEAQYDSLIRNHIIPRWGTTCLDSITGIGVRSWKKKLRTQGYAESTIKTIVKILSMMLADAADEQLIAANPIKPQRRGKRQHAKRKEALWATPEQVLRIALQAAGLVGIRAAILIITAAWTGARWGELTGLQRINTHLDDGRIVIDPDIGALHEVGSSLYLGPPKTAESIRTITLPSFLIRLLQWLLDSHDHPHVFVTTDGQLLRRSNFARRAMRPAADGNLNRKRPPIWVHPVVPGLTFHQLRHSHKTWLIADAIPEVAQALRLGHIIQDEVKRIYSHIAPEVEVRLLNALETRWANAVATMLDTANTPDTTHRPNMLELLPSLTLTAA
ncbi:site-specific integrase [Kibdelosporangium philippinense]|uniref:Site-specific integrase n=2 Tax=Kibdelosporangium philippinense TaxID=211113 RepID=A0ABS8ZQ66_9PSEU|nr:site-specific integrase [Kibdelosporangium philippinense]MCE7009900.1 site-specific integrase [Kibdelosporangium philippinense]